MSGRVVLDRAETPRNRAFDRIPAPGNRGSPGSSRGTAARSGLLGSVQQTPAAVSSAQGFGHPQQAQRIQLPQT